MRRQIVRAALAALALAGPMTATAPAGGITQGPAYQAQQKPGYQVQQKPGYQVQYRPGYQVQQKPSYQVQQTPGQYKGYVYRVYVSDPRFEQPWVCFGTYRTYDAARAAAAEADGPGCTVVIERHRS